MSTRVRGVEIQSLVQYWIDCLLQKQRSFSLDRPPCTSCTTLVPKVGAHCPPTPPSCAAHAYSWCSKTCHTFLKTFKFCLFMSDICYYWLVILLLCYKVRRNTSRCAEVRKLWNKSINGHYTIHLMHTIHLIDTIRLFLSSQTTWPINVRSDNKTELTICGYELNWNW